MSDETWYAVVGPDGFRFPSSISFTSADEAMQLFLNDRPGQGWGELYRNGYRVVGYDVARRSEEGGGR